jgi:DNA-binding PadR family transcriptional regulator
LEFHKLIYEHHSAEELLSRLQELGPSAKDMPAYVKRDKQGNLKKADFPWLSTARGKRNTVFGNFVITPDRLTVEVNSARRASLIRAMIARRAGKLVRLTEHGKKTLDEMLNQKAPKKFEPIDVKSNPDLLAYWHEYMTNHWSNWIHEKLPALNGKTPAQAVKTAKGRELVEELLNWMEKTAIDRPGMPSQKQFIDGARKQLGL